MAYNGLIKQGDGVGFRDFLLQAPARFSRLGEELASVDHMVSFWQYRFPCSADAHRHGRRAGHHLRDFESGLRVQSLARHRDLAQGVG